MGFAPRRYVLDDSWEDETGYVRSKARKFKNKGMLHDAGLMPPGDSPLRPSLPLLYNLSGEPYVGSRAPFKRIISLCTVHQSGHAARYFSSAFFFFPPFFLVG